MVTGCIFHEQKLLALASRAARIFQADTLGTIQADDVTLSQDSQHLASVRFTRQVPFSDSSSCHLVATLKCQQGSKGQWPSAR